MPRASSPSLPSSVAAPPTPLSPSTIGADRVSVLIVDDSREFQQLIEAALRDHNARIRFADDGESAIELCRNDPPDLVILDLGLPDIDGLEVCRRLRKFSDAYVLMLTARDDEVDMLIGLAVGADNYMTKPFSPRELQARVQALLRRPRSPAAAVQPNMLTIQDLSLDLQAREVTRDGREIKLTRIEFDLLATLASNPSMVFERKLLFEQVWGAEVFGDTHVVDVHIANLRKKIDTSDQRHIKTVRGIGYRLAA